PPSRPWRNGYITGVAAVAATLLMGGGIAGCQPEPAAPPASSVKPAEDLRALTVDTPNPAAAGPDSPGAKSVEAPAKDSAGELAVAGTPPSADPKVEAPGDPKGLPEKDVY